MLFIILLGLALAPSGFATAAPAADQAAPSRSLGVESAGKDCPRPEVRMADEMGRGARPRRLDELPPGRLEYAVFREVEGCAIPAVVHDGVTPSFRPQGKDR